MKAPSERHLQDYLFAHQGVMGEIPGLYEDEPYFEYEIFAREARLPSGRADFLAESIDRYALAICCIEVKKDALNSKSLAQCLRYMRDIKAVWQYAIQGLPDAEPGAVHYNEIPRVYGLLIGASIDDDTLISCGGAGVGVAIYDFDGTDYTLSFPETEVGLGVLLDYAYGYIGEQIRKSYMDCLQSMFTPEKIEQMPRRMSLAELREFYAERGML